jgi:hypothetical protein
LFAIININPPKCLLPDKYVPSSSRNTIVQNVENGMDIKDQVNPMEEEDTNNVVDPNDGTNRFLGHICSYR